MLQFIKYKARSHGVRSVQVNPINTSQTCSQCGHRDQKSPHSKRFHCTNIDCRYEADADANAAANIANRGAYYYLKRYGIGPHKTAAALPAAAERRVTKAGNWVRSSATGGSHGLTLP